MMTTQELTQAFTTMNAKMAAMNEKLNDACAHMEGIEKEVREQGKLLQSIDRLAMGLSRLDEKMGDLSDKITAFGSRINLMELKPAEKWEKIGFEVVKYLVLAGIGYAIAKL